MELISRIHQVCISNNGKGEGSTLCGRPWLRNNYARECLRGEIVGDRKECPECFKRVLWCEGTNHGGEYEWEDICAEVSNLMDELAPVGAMWTAEVENFGWQGLDGHREAFEASDGAELLLAVLPDTECSFKVYREGNRIAIDNAHHDKPCGGEWYTLRPVLS